MASLASRRLMRNLIIVLGPAAPEAREPVCSPVPEPVAAPFIAHHQPPSDSESGIVVDIRANYRRRLPLHCRPESAHLPAGFHIVRLAIRRLHHVDSEIRPWYNRIRPAWPGRERESYEAQRGWPAEEKHIPESTNFQRERTRSPVGTEDRRSSRLSTTATTKLSALDNSNDEALCSRQQQRRQQLCLVSRV